MSKKIIETTNASQTEFQLVDKYKTIDNQKIRDCIQGSFGNDQLSYERVKPELGVITKANRSIIITDKPFDDNWFSHSTVDYWFMTVSNWDEKYAPPPMNKYILHGIIQFLAISAANLNESQIKRKSFFGHTSSEVDCLFGFRSNKNDIKITIQSGEICDNCKQKLLDTVMTIGQFNAINTLLRLMAGSEMAQVNKIFISATFADLAEERIAVRQLISELGHIPVEFLSKGYHPEQVVSIIDNCDCFVIIIGDKYGTIRKNDSISYVEWEYDYAHSKGKPILAFMKNLGVENVRKCGSKLIAFREKILKTQVCQLWETSAELIDLIGKTINNKNFIKHKDDRTLTDIKADTKKLIIKGFVDSAITAGETTHFSQAKLKNISDMYMRVQEFYGSINEVYEVRFKGKYSREPIYKASEPITIPPKEIAPELIRHDLVMALFKNSPNGVKFSLSDISTFIKQNNIREMFLDTGEYILCIGKPYGFNLVSENESERIIKDLFAIFDEVSEVIKSELDIVIENNEQRKYDDILYHSNKMVWIIAEQNSVISIDFCRIKKSDLFINGTSISTESNEINIFEHCTSVEQLCREAILLLSVKTKTGYNQINLIGEVISVDDELLDLFVCADAISEGIFKHSSVAVTPKGLISQSFYSGKTMNISDVRLYPNYISELLQIEELPEIRSELVVPIVSNGKVCGVFNSKSYSVGYYVNEIENEIQNICNNIAQKLNALGYDISTSIEPLPYISIEPLDEICKIQIEKEINNFNRPQTVLLAWLCTMRILPFLTRSNFFDSQEYLLKNIYSIFKVMDTAYLGDVGATRALAYLSRAINESVNGRPFIDYINAANIYVENNDNISNHSTTPINVIFNNSDVAATDAVISVITASRCCGYDFYGIIMSDIKRIRNENELICDSYIYNDIWNSFKESLVAVDCGYWWSIYSNIFTSAFDVDKEELNRRLSVPSFFQKQGARVVAEYLNETVPLIKNETESLIESKTANKVKNIKLCFGVFAKLLMLCSQKRSKVGIVNVLIKSIDSDCEYSQSTANKIIRCLVNLPASSKNNRLGNGLSLEFKPDVTDVSRYFSENIIHIIDYNKRELFVLALLKIIMDDESILHNDIIEIVSNSTKRELKVQNEFVLSDFLAGVFL